jgi:hypothetical protein
MKIKIIGLSLLLASAAGAQITNMNNGAYQGDPTAGSVWSALQTGNADFDWIGAQLAALPDAQTNSVLNSFKNPLWSTNSISFATTNWVILPVSVTNYAGTTFSYAQGGGLTFNYSTDGGASWWPDSGTLITNIPVMLAFTNVNRGAFAPSIPAILTNLTIYVQTRPDLFAKSNSVIGQDFMVGTPLGPNDATPKSYVDGLMQATPWWSAPQSVQLNGYPLNFNPIWQVSSATNSASITWNYIGTPAVSISGPAATYASVSNILVQTNWVFLLVRTNSVTSPIIPQYTASLLQQSWLTVPAYTSTYPFFTNGLYTVTFPIPNPNAAFIRLAFFPPGAAVLSSFGSLWQTLSTVTNSTDSTAGWGAGVMKWDTNYIYVSVGTNQWKRAALSTW